MKEEGTKRNLHLHQGQNTSIHTAIQRQTKASDMETSITADQIGKGRVQLTTIDLLVKEDTTRRFRRDTDRLQEGTLLFTQIRCRKKTEETVLQDGMIHHDGTNLHGVRILHHAMRTLQDETEMVLHHHLTHQGEEAAIHHQIQVTATREMTSTIDVINFSSEINRTIKIRTRLPASAGSQQTTIEKRRSTASTKM